MDRRQVASLPRSGKRPGPDPESSGDVHIHWLRAKIESQPRRPIYLVTVRGCGYRLDPPPR